MNPEDPHKFSEDDVVRFTRDFGRPLPDGFKENVLSKARALDKSPKQELKKTNTPTQQRDKSRGMAR